MPFSRDTILKFGMTLGECVASSPLAEARLVEATKVGYPCLVCTKQVEAVKPVTARGYPPPPPR